MNTSKIITLGAKITLDDISQLDKTIDTSLEIENLKEDLFQATFPCGQILDIGWHPEFSTYGSFVISLIRNQDWQNPTHCEKAKNWAELKIALENILKNLES
ncbi:MULTISPECIES: hypothetical protein [Pseudomonas]|uniref:hypothetical protein n=1 Tax=Pseudomonas TaxID=286 RepID=UPI000A1E7E20|nr:MULTISPECIES: hypothetical protein [Pseudomonas]MCX4218931.1 hypothetical protein [Pseudomonas sp. MCal1]UIN53196.1 hypothetical protein LXN51_19725 [Pseudomonas kribbensis]